MSGAEGHEIKNAVTQIALDLGFDDIRYTENPIPGDKPTATFLVKRYTPTNGVAEEGRIALSEYYPASQFGHIQSSNFIERLKEELGLESEKTDAFNYKQVIVKTGGTIGLNSLYYHPKFGSFISMRCVLIGADILPDREIPTKNLCMDCELCADACPTLAIDADGFTREKCLRNMMSEGIPEYARKHVYQLLGCERCQLCCPMNLTELKEPRTYELLAVIREQETKALKELCGKNMATRTRLLTQSLAYAATNNFSQALSDIEELTEDESDRVREMAVWAKQALKK